MNTYEEFVKPNLRIKDGYEHIICLRYLPDTYGDPNDPKFCVDKLNTNKFDEIFVCMQKDGYEIIEFHLNTVNDAYRQNMIIKYK